MNETNTDQNQKPKTSKLAIASIICLGLFICLGLLFGLSFLGMFAPFPIWYLAFVGFFTAPILGIAALIHIGLSKDRLSGRWLAAFGITVPILIALFFNFLIHYKAYLAQRIICEHTIKFAGEAIRSYASDNGDNLPPAKSWCNLLITETYIDHDSRLHCTTSNSPFKAGESSYALNKNVVGMKLSEIPDDIVLLFETDFGRIESGRDTPKKSRDYFWIINEPKDKWGRSPMDGEELVYKDCWNQVGGPEILTVNNHKGRGCNILFVDGHAEFIKTKDLDTLRWEP